MAKISRGKNKDKIVQISQYANDWVSLKNGEIVKPTSLVYTQKEIEQMLQPNTVKSMGFFHSMWKMYLTGDIKYPFTYRKRKLK